MFLFQNRRQNAKIGLLKVQLNATKIDKQNEIKNLKKQLRTKTKDVDLANAKTSASQSRIISLTQNQNYLRKACTSLQKEKKST